MASERRTVRHRLLLALAAAALVGIGGVVGVLASSDKETKHTATEPLNAAGAGAIGNASVGRQLLVSQHCSDCHSYQGRGGSDAPPLDMMKGQLSAKDIANMSGTIWNHEPAMVARFKEEKIPYPTFSANEMADLIAYLHEGGPPPDVGKGQTMGAP
jgi:mono/diheme cytochrome c family protein